jgi:hypothetical protein
MYPRHIGNKPAVNDQMLAQHGQLRLTGVAIRQGSWMNAVQFK